MSKVKIKLAHALNEQAIEYLGLPPGQYGPNADVVILARDAPSLINSGYAQVEPGKPQAVAAASEPSPSLDNVPLGLFAAPASPAEDTPEPPKSGRPGR